MGKLATTARDEEAGISGVFCSNRCRLFSGVYWVDEYKEGKAATGHCPGNVCVVRVAQITNAEQCQGGNRGKRLVM